MQELIDEIASSILQTVREPALILDGDFHIKMANQACYELLPLVFNSVVTRTLDEVMPDIAGISELNERLRDVRAYNRPLENFSLHFNRSPDTQHTFRLNARRVHPAVDLIFVTFQGIDEQELRIASNIEEERFRVALKNSHIAVFNQDADLRYTWIYNDPLGFSNDTVLGKTDADIFAPETAAELTRLKRQVLATGQGLRQEILLIQGEDSFYRDLTIEPLYDTTGKAIGITGAAADITDRKMAEEALRESEEWFSKAFHLSPAPMTIVSVKDQRYIDVNASAEQLSGFSREEMIGHTSAELHTLRESDGRSELWGSITHLESVRNRETTLNTKSGEVRHILGSAEVVTIGNESYVLGLMQDITERKKVEEALRQSEERFSKVFHASPIGIIIYSVADEQILDANESSERVTGYSRSELIGHTTGELNITFSEETRTQFWQTLNDSKSIRNRESRIRTKQGILRDALLSADIVTLDNRPCVMGTVLDITERKRAEVQTLELAVEREKQRVLEQLLLTASHDLRTPISAVSVTAYLLNKLTDKLILQCTSLRDDPGYVSLQGAKQWDELNSTLATLKTYVARMDKSADRLKHLVEKMFDMVRLDMRPDFEFTPSDLNPLVNRVVDAYIPKATKKTLNLHFVPGADLPSVSLDADEFERVVRNLLENAIYYTSGDGEISVKTYLENEWTVLEVKDTGVGIAESDLPHVFERFFRADRARSTETGGSGLGLAIAQKIVEAHGGRIEAMSVLGHGSIFRVLIPIDTPVKPPKRS